MSGSLSHKPNQLPPVLKIHFDTLAEQAVTLLQQKDDDNVTRGDED
jgi:hypothetical protein